MTSRRAFLGLLAAAPVVAPAMAKAAASEIGTMRLMSGSVVRFAGSPGCSNPIRYMDVQSLKLSVDTTEVEEALKQLAARRYEPVVDAATVPEWAADEHWRLLPEYQRRIEAQRTPNRLFGAYINEHGEAV